MHCFNHSGVAGVALCKSCGRALCHDCIAEIGTSSACRGRCEAAVTRLNDLVERTQSVYPRTAATYLRSGVFVILLGAAFSWLGLGPILKGSHDSAAYVFTSIGVLFAVWGVIQLGVSRKWRSK